MGCTASKSSEMQAEMEDWGDEDTISSKSFMRSLSMPIRHIKSLQQENQKKKQDQKQISNSSLSNLTTSNSCSSSDQSSSDHSGNLALVNHMVSLTSTSYGAIRMDHKQEEHDEQQQSTTARNNAGRSTEAEDRSTINGRSTSAAAAPLPAVPEAEVIDVGALMRDLNDKSSNVKKKRARNRVLNRSISSVDSMRELDLKIRALALSLPNLDEKMRALDALQSIVTSRREEQENLQKKIKGLFYGKTLAPSFSNSPSPSSSSSSSSSREEQLLPGSCDSISPSASSSSLTSMTIDQPLESNIIIDERGGGDAGAFEKHEASSSSSSTMATATTTARWDLIKRMSSKVCSIDEEEGQEGRKMQAEATPQAACPVVGNADEDCRHYACPPGGEKRAVLYITSLRGIRKTFEDCNRVRMILRASGVAIDERDVSMHSEFRQELKDLMSRMNVGGAVPRLFVRGRYIGGAEEVAELNEGGGMAAVLDQVPRVENGDMVCQGCGDARFVPCAQCRGSCKLVLEEEDAVVRCNSCNENGLVRCPVCL